MFTASHNPAQYNGIKLCRAGAAPVGEDTGLAQIKAAVAGGLLERAEEAGRVERARPARRVRRRTCAPSSTSTRCARCGSSPTPPTAWAASSCPTVFDGLPFDLTVLFGELDGTFPNHPADPIQPENLKDLQKAVLDAGADVGLAFDGDADRVFLVDDQGQPVSGSTTTAIVAEASSPGTRGETVVHNLICSKAVPEVIRENGGVPVRTRVGHSFIKQVMAETGAIFGGEHSAHYYFRDNWRADSGIDRGAGGARAAVAGGRAALGAAQARSSATPRRARSTPRSPTRARSSSASPRTTPTPSRTGSTASPSISATGGSTCGRATPSRCCGSTSRRPTAPRAMPTPRRSLVRSIRADLDRAERRSVVALDPKLLEILACPDDKGPLLYFADERRSTTRG